MSCPVGAKLCLSVCLFVLFFRVLRMAGNNLSKFLCKMLDERVSSDFGYLFRLEVNPFVVRSWEDVKPYQVGPRDEQVEWSSFSVLKL